ncbi:hypothetical protein ACHAPB_004423 [Verticillium nonalfalfae]
MTVSGDTSQLEISFAESKAAFSNFMGAFRYQKFNLSSAGSLKIRNIGVKPTTHTTPLTELPGSFECSDEDLTRIWHTGARTAQLTEIPKDTIPDFWQITEQGAFVESVAPQVYPSTEAAQALSYEVTFEAKPVTGEFGFSVLASTLNDGIYISFDVVAGKISAHETATTLGPILATGNLTQRSPGSWHAVHARVDSGAVKVALDNTTVLEFAQSTYVVGSFGVGASFGHSAYFRNLMATTLEGTEIYSSSMMDKSVIEDFQLGRNPADTIVDGSRRDRIAYNGDLDVALGATLASTSGTSFIEAKIQQSPQPYLTNSNLTGLIGYSFNLVAAFAQSYEASGNLTFAQRWAPAAVLMLDWAHSQTMNGLFAAEDPIFAGDWNYYDPPQIGVSSKFNAVYAYSMQQSLPMFEAAGVDTKVYRERLSALRSAMNSQLWDESLGAYVMLDSLRDGFSQDANSIAILAGVPQAQNISPSAILSTLNKELLLPAGPLAFSNATAKAGYAQKISPYASAYHLRAALQSKDAATSMSLLRSLWAPMADPSHANYTNCFWETLDPDGTPGLGLITSLCHGWGAGPTAELSAHVLGIQAVTAGFQEWRVRPQTLGLEWAKGRYRTVRGDVHVDWRFEKDLLRMEVDGPDGGMVYLPEPLLVPVERSIIKVNGAVVQGTSFEIPKDKKFVLEQSVRCTKH